MWKCIAAALLPFTLLSGAQAQAVYKWVDDQGKTHYGSQPPSNDKTPEAMKLHNSSTFGGNNNPSTQTGATYNADGAKKISKDVQELGDGFIKGLKKVDSKTVPLDCSAAVDNIHHQADLMLEVAQKNIKDGYLSQADFDANAPKIRQAKSNASMGDCQVATGNKKSFYQCMSSSRNHVTGCGSKFKF
jgi:hypothetical protein